MRILKPLYWMITKDPYWVGPKAWTTGFYWKNTYIATSDCGFKLRYTISCFVDKFDHDQFKAARLLEEENQRRLIDAWHNEVFLPKFREWRCLFKYLSPRYQLVYDTTVLCRVVKEGNEEFIIADPKCIDLIEELRKAPRMVKDGCRVRICTMIIEAENVFTRDEQLTAADEQLLEENYNMIKVRNLASPEGTEAFRAWEETTVISLLHRHMELRREFYHIQTNREHKSKLIQIKTRLVGNAVELSWDFSDYEQDGRVLRGYRNEGGFPTSGGLNANGACVVETQVSKGSCIQNLNEDREYFFTFMLTRDEPVYAKQTFIQGLFSSPAVEKVSTNVLDSLRFSVRMPTRAELMHVESVLEKLKTDPNSKREKFRRMFEELSEFVEFDESLSQWEKDLVKRIEGKDYTPDEKKHKIAQLRGVIGSIRIASEPVPNVGN